MYNNTKEDASALAKRNAETVNGLLTKNKAALMRSIPTGFNYDRMCRTVINAISTVPAIAKCTPASVFLSCVRAFSLGLEPNGALAEGYLIPFWNSKKGINEAQFMPSYRGLINLARRSGEIKDIYANVVFEKDEFTENQGTERSLQHRPYRGSDKGKAILYYAVYHTKDGGVDFEVMDMEEIAKIRQASKSANSGPWVDWFDEMAKKTVMKRLLKRAPMSIELASAVSLENAAATGEGNADVLDIEGLEVPEEAAENPQKEINADKLAELKAKVAEAKADTAAADKDSLV